MERQISPEILNIDRNKVISVKRNEKNIVLSLIMYDKVFDVFNKLPQDSEIKVYDFLLEVGKGSTYEAFFYEDSHKSFFYLKDLVNYIFEIKAKSGVEEFYISQVDVDIDSMSVIVNEAIVDFIFELMEDCKNFLKWLIEVIYLKKLVDFEKLFYYLIEWKNQYVEVDKEFNIVAVHRDLEAYRTAWLKA